MARFGVYVIAMLIGGVIGGAVWHVFSPVMPEALRMSYAIGSTGGPWNIDLQFIQLAFGLVIRFNIGTGLGIIAGLLLARKW